MKKFDFILIAIFTLFLMRGWTDGMMFSFEEIDQEITGQNLITENSQRVFIIHDSETGAQKTVIEVRTGESQGHFIWMIPIVNEEDISVEDFILTVKEETDCNSRFNSLSVQTGPKIIYSRHEVIEHYSPGSDMVFGCGCGMAMMGTDMEGGTGDLGDSESEEENMPDWSSTETENFTVDMIKGENGYEIMNWLASQGLTVISATAADLVEHYDDYDNIGYLLLRGRRNTPGEIRTGISYVTKNTVPFFPLEISRPGFHTRMDIEIYTAGTESWKPEGLCRDYLWDINLDSYWVRLMSRSEWNTTSPADGLDELYYTSYEYSGASNQDLYSAAIGMLEEIEYYQYEDYDSQPAWNQTFSGVMANSALPFLEDYSIQELLYVTAFRRSVTDSNELEDLVLTRDSDIHFRGGLRIHAAVHADRELTEKSTPRDLGLLLPLAFPAWLAAGKLKRKTKYRKNRK